MSALFTSKDLELCVDPRVPEGCFGILKDSYVYCYRVSIETLSVRYVKRLKAARPVKFGGESGSEETEKAKEV